MTDRTGQIAVIFVSTRTDSDPQGYAAAAEAMDHLAAQQPGYRGVDSARGADGLGITVSWWADEASALAWRARPEHAAIRDRGRAEWYARYEVAVAQVGRSYGWENELSHPAG
ncbi:antibiotic biosynthesis monooxygenase [uncultured Sphingomonas sp.]|uniref:antibiotic biosynthesis monooxygenase family protein n=1 Tax=uncultured Sphingomonas sp. TaxID=158754 RepID=UPI0025DAD51A|nr:antibiotic biosynthesis monooxygenase [uncultured Sphingomonas sp.]